jgi:serine phosphatase RsbU (regulator of sigma subunit)
LEKSRDLVIETFSESVENVQDGMDIALCSLNTRTNELQYAGANNPIWIIRNGQSIIEEIKADKQHIGNSDIMNPFTNHIIQLKKGDIFYIFTDGYQDQFGGPKEKKIKSKPFKNLLLSICNEPLEKQEYLLDEHLKGWKGKLDQVDDICIAGIKI